MSSPCLHRSWHFQYKIFTLPLVFPQHRRRCYLSPYGFERESGVGASSSRPIFVVTAEERERKMLSMANVGIFTLTCHPFLNRGGLSRERYSNTEKMNSWPPRVKAGSYIITLQSAVKRKHHTICETLGYVDYSYLGVRKIKKRNVCTDVLRN